MSAIYLVLSLLTSVLADCTPGPRAPGCGVYGNAPYDPEDDFYLPAEPFHVSDALACADACASMRTGPLTCQSFSFKNDTRLCRLARRGVDEVVLDRRSKTIFFNQTCFDCGPTCPTPTDDNLIVNGDFGFDTLGPFAAEGGSFGVGQDGSRAFKCASTFFCGITQEFNQCDGGLYTLQYDYLINEAPTSANVFYYAAGDSYFELRPSQKGAWATQIAAFRGNLSASRIVNQDYGARGPGLRLTNTLQNSGDTVAVDNIKITRVNSAGVVGPNLLQNAGFESGVLSPWKSTGAKNRGPLTILSPGIRSNFSVGIATQPTYDDSRLLSQLVPTKPGSKYIVTLQISANTTRPGAAVQLSLTTALGSRNASDQQNILMPIRIGISNVSTIYHAQYTNVSVGLQIFNIFASSRTRVDNLSFRELATSD